MNNPNLADNMQSLTDMSLPWNVEECDECGLEYCECEEEDNE